MNKPEKNIWMLLGYILGAAMVVTGVLILSGYLQLRFASNKAGEGNEMLRVMFGLILVLYGVYRIVVANSVRQRQVREQRGERG